MRLETTGKRYGRNDEASGGLLVGAGGGPDGTLKTNPSEPSSTLKCPKFARIRTF